MLINKKMCAKKNPLGSNFINQRGTTHFGGKEINDKIVNYIINENKEGKTLPEGFFEIGKYKDITYKINRDGTVIGKDGRPINPSLRNGKLYITIKTNNGKTETKSVLSLLEQVFGPYYKGYSKKLKEPNLYELRTIDGNYQNLTPANLEYAHILEGTVEGLIITLVDDWGIDFDVILRGLRPTVKTVNDLIKIVSKYRQRSPEILDFKKKYKINFRNERYPAYKLLTESNGAITDDEIKEKTGLTSSDIEFIRKELTDHGVITNKKNKK